MLFGSQTKLTPSTYSNDNMKKRKRNRIIEVTNLMNILHSHITKKKLYIHDTWLVLDGAIDPNSVKQKGLGLS